MQGRAAGKAFAVVDSENFKVASLKLRCAELHAAIKVKDKKVYLDSGVNTSSFADINHVDPSISPSFCRIEKPHGVKTASRELLTVERTGQIADAPGLFCPGTGTS